MQILESCTEEQRQQCLKRFDNTVRQLQWSGYIGLAALTARGEWQSTLTDDVSLFLGVSSSFGCESAIGVLRLLVDELAIEAVGGSGSFSLIVVGE